MKRSARIYVVIAVVVLTVVFLIGSGLQDTMVYYVTVDELNAHPAENEGRGLRVNGLVVAGSVVTQAGTTHRFLIREGEAEIPVHYQGILPDTFKENHDVLVEGKFRSDGVIVAERIFTKCASKYDAASPHPEMPGETS